MLSSLRTFHDKGYKESFPKGIRFLIISSKKSIRRDLKKFADFKEFFDPKRIYIIQTIYLSKSKNFTMKIREDSIKSKMY